MQILITEMCIALAVYVAINLILQFSEMFLVYPFRIKQFVAYLLALSFGAIPFVVKTEQKWVLAVFSIAFAIYFFVESFIARDDFFYQLQRFQEQQEMEESNNNGENSKKK